MSYTNSAANADLKPPSVYGTVKSNVQTSINHIGNVTSNNLNHYFPPAHRQASKEWLVLFAQERPYLAAFLLSQLVLSGPPLAFFLITTISLVTFFVLTGLLLGLLGALFFTSIAIGISLLILVPVLIFTTISAVSIWVWGSVIYYLVKRFNNGKVPNINLPAGLVSGWVAKASGFSKASDVDADAREAVITAQSNGNSKIAGSA